MLKKVALCLLFAFAVFHLLPQGAQAKKDKTFIEMKYEHVIAYEKRDGKLRPYIILHSKQAYELEGAASKSWHKLKLGQKDLYVAKIRTKKTQQEKDPSANIPYEPINQSINIVNNTPVWSTPSSDGKMIASLFKGLTYSVTFESGDFYGIDIGGIKGFIEKSAVVTEPAYTKAVPVLMYHHLLKKDENLFPSNNVILNVESFEQQMKYLADHGYHTITADDLVRFMKGEQRLDEKSVLITFDDGHKTNYLYAYPILKKYNMHAASFIITNRIQTQTTAFDPARLQFLSAEEMQLMTDVFEFGSHTHGLHNLEGMTSHVLLKSTAELLDDFQISRDILQTAYFCYPFGQYNLQTISLLKQAGYQAAFSTKKGYAEPYESLYEIERFGIYPATTMEEFKKIVSGLYEKNR